MAKLKIIKTGLKDIGRGYKTLYNISKGRKADKLRKKVKKTRPYKTAPARDLRVKAGITRKRAKDFLK